MPLEDPPPETSWNKVFDITKLPQKTFDVVKYFCTQYLYLLENTSFDIVEAEFLSLQVEKLSDNVINEHYAADRHWHLIFQIPGVTGHPKYANIAAITKAILCIPHSNTT